MVCARQVTVREYPEFYAQDVGVVPEGGIVRVFEEKEVEKPKLVVVAVVVLAVESSGGRQVMLLTLTAWC